jgi:hypothetical protein
MFADRLGRVALTTLPKEGAGEEARGYTNGLA